MQKSASLSCTANIHLIQTPFVHKTMVKVTKSPILPTWFAHDKRLPPLMPSLSHHLKSLNQPLVLLCETAHYRINMSIASFKLAELFLIFHPSLTAIWFVESVVIFTNLGCTSSAVKQVWTQTHTSETGRIGENSCLLVGSGVKCPLDRRGQTDWTHG